jgi:ORF 12 gene product N-terminal
MPSTTSQYRRAQSAPRRGRGTKPPRPRAGLKGPGARALASAISALAVVALSLSPAVASSRPTGEAASEETSAVKVPTNALGAQLRWLLGLAGHLPLSTPGIKAHFDAAFLAQVAPTAINKDLEAVIPAGSVVTLLAVAEVERTSLQALVKIGARRYSLQLSVDAAGLISGLLLRLASAPSPSPPVGKPPHRPNA